MGCEANSEEGLQVREQVCQATKEGSRVQLPKPVENGEEEGVRDEGGGGENQEETQLGSPELVVNCVSGKIGRGRRRRGSRCRGGIRKRFDADMNYLFDCKISICANKYVCISKK